MSNADPEWRLFERSVAAFVSALDVNATVSHDVRLPDRHHHRPRQRDVLIEAKVCGHFPVTILVSCKRLARKLDSGHIDAFNGELASSQARMGVIYSYSGFTEPAIDKAKALGIPCCQLFNNQPPTIPEILTFDWYCCTPRIQLRLSQYGRDESSISTWGEILTLSRDGTDRLLVDEVVSRYHEAESAAVDAATTQNQGIPQPFQSEVLLSPHSECASAAKVTAIGTWRFYRARIEAYAINGSYEFTSGDFKGNLATPAIDRLGSEPGPGWERLDNPPDASEPKMVIILYGGGARGALLEQLSDRRIVSDEGQART